MKTTSSSRAVSLSHAVQRTSTWLKATVIAVAAGVTLPTFADYPIASHRYLADPSALVYNGRLYIYCSNDDDNTGSSYAMHSIVCVSTDDLKNWTDHGVVFNVPANCSWATCSWAPSVAYRNSKFYLYFGNVTYGIGVASSTSATGPFYDAKGSYLVNGNTPGASGVSQWYFDPCVFVNDDGQAYLYFGGYDVSNARVIKLNSDMISVSGSATAISAPNFFEASHMHKRNGVYYYSYEDHAEQGLWIEYMTSSSPTSGFVSKGKVLQAPSNNNNNHHSFVSFNGNWYAAYHNRYISGNTYKRNLCLDKLNYNTDGTMQTVSCTLDGLTQLKNVDPYSVVQAETFAQQSGVETDVTYDGGGGMKLISIDAGDWIRIRKVDFGSTTAKTFSARVYSYATGGKIELRLDGTSGTLIGTCTVPNTGGVYSTVSTSVSTVTGVHDLYLKFTGGFGGVNWWQFAR